MNWCNDKSVRLLGKVKRRFLHFGTGLSKDCWFPDISEKSVKLFLFVIIFVILTFQTFLKLERDILVTFDIYAVG